MIQIARGRFECRDHLDERASADHAEFGFEGCDRCLVDVVDHAVMAVALETAHHVGAHPAEPDHPELHGHRLPRSVKVDALTQHVGRSILVDLGDGNRDDVPDLHDE